MKARNNKTGEIVTDFAISKEFGTISYFDSNKTLRLATACDNEWTIIDEESTFDWQSFRNQAAKDILCATLSGGISSGATGFLEEKENVVKTAIKIADELIKQLKGSRDDRL